jgi:flagellar hook-length control protein FliK
MRVQKTGAQARHEVAGAKPGTQKSDRFSRVLQIKREESAPKFNLTGDNQSSVANTVTRQPENISSIPASADLERLATEIVDHISSHHSDGTPSLEIQFNSQTLEGMRVNVRRTEQGQVAIHFLTPVPRVAALVQKNLSSLRSALESKGMRIAQLQVNRRAG